MESLKIAEFPRYSKELYTYVRGTTLHQLKRFIIRDSGLSTEWGLLVLESESSHWPNEDESRLETSMKWFIRNQLFVRKWINANETGRFKM